MAKPQRLAATQPMLKSAQTEARTRIQVGTLIARAQKIALGEVEGEPGALAVQMRATEMLLRKALPDLSSVEMTGAEGGPLTITIIKQT